MKLVCLAKMKRVVTIILLLFLMTLLMGCGDIKMKKGVEEYIGDNYIKVIDELKQLGFSDIKTIEIADLTSYGETQDGTVSEVSIEGNTEFSIDTAFSKDAKVVVTYHIVQKLSLPVTLDQVSGMGSVEIVDAFTNVGFINIQVEEVYDLDPDEIEEAYQNEIKINDDMLLASSDVYPFDAEVKVICHYPYEKYDIELKIDFIGNLFFNKYDVTLLVDDSEQSILEHGEDWEGTLRLKAGEHTIKFAKRNASSVKGETVLDVTSKIAVEYKIYCYGDDIDVKIVYLDREVELADNEVKVLCTESNYRGKNYKTIKQELVELGFVNIRTKPVYDIIWGITEKESISNVMIGGANDYKRGDIFLNDVEVVITYHMPYEDDPENKVVEEEKDSDKKTSDEESEKESSQKKPIYDSDAEVLDEYDAWKAVEEYGESQYSTFDLHYMSGKLLAEQKDDNTWNLKALCDVDTGNGVVKNCNCEATVEGTNLDKRVTYFIVY